ncbi:glycerophosphodiester phosphodiesterase [Paenibacillus massiliensis]|uniref:glycerophosphodiester phosphodiesterase n=1 Tax=Paenibacillus massiliensis TaxID=225917 RepID=UPI000423E0C2|nr:glycerophosphodiester phosphodiesterase family protein [Paenibacillus massiliensis]
MRNGCAAHRGCSNAAPENTMAAFQLALDCSAVSWIELDVQLSRDGVPMVIHDFKVDRTTNGTGLVRDMTSAELARLDAGAWKSSKYAGEHVPQLSEVLDLCQGSVSLNIELKTSGNMYPGLEKAVLREIMARRMERDVVLTSFDRQALRQVKALDSEIRTGLIIDAAPNDLAEQLDKLECTFLSLGYPHVNKQLLRKMAEREIIVMAWTVDQLRLMRRLAAMDSELLICTNRPELWPATISKRNWLPFL